MIVPPAALTPGHGQRGKGLSTILLWLLQLQKDDGCGECMPLSSVSEHTSISGHP